MEPIKYSKVYNAAMWHGLILSIYLVVRFFFIVSSGQNFLLNLLVIGLTIGIPFMAFYLGKDFSKKSEEELTYRKFFSHGFFMFFFASLILALVEYLYYNHINPDFISTQYEALIQSVALLKETMPEATQLEEVINNSPMPTATQMSMQNIWMYSFAGIIISLINAYILNKTK